MHSSADRTPQISPDSIIAEERSKYYLQPGQIFASKESHAVTTILGSCVAVCLWDPELGIGGINHYLLPAYNGEVQPSTRFGDIAISELLSRLTRLGCDKRRLRAKLFGGACVLEAFRERKNHLGSQNVAIARELLATEAITVVRENVGGQRGRKLVFFTDDGSAWIKEL